MTVSSTQCRMGRRALGLSREKFAELAGLDEKTIYKFEHEVVKPHPKTEAAITKALKGLGLKFSSTGVAFPGFDATIDRASHPL